MPTDRRWPTPAAWLAWSVTAVAGAVLVTQAAGWHGTRIVAVVQSLTPYLGMAVIAVAAIAMWRHRLLLATTAVAVGAGVVVITAPLVVPDAQPSPDPTSAGTTIASVNLLYTNERVEEVADVLLDADADVVVLSEYTREHRDVFEAHPLADRYDHRVNRNGRGPIGLAVWSREPVEVADTLDTYNASVDLTVQSADGPLRIVGVHVSTPTSNFDAWRRDLGLIEEIGHAADDPTAVIGDLNATYWHPDFRALLDAGFVDAHIAAGQGFATSWPADGFVPPFVQLDHALTTGGLVSTDVVDVDVPGSDHRGFVVTVARARPAAP